MYHLAINRPILSSARLTEGTASCILPCLWCFEDNCSVIWCVFCWWKGIGPMHWHCSAYLTCRLQGLYAERVGRPRVSVNSEILLHVHEPLHVHVSGDNLLQVLWFVILCGSEFRWRPMFFLKTFLVNSTSISLFLASEPNSKNRFQSMKLTIRRSGKPWWYKKLRRWKTII
jgi:hypothetical protein